MKTSASSASNAGLAALQSSPQAATLTPFRRSVLEALCRVPAGKVTTYKHLAAAVDCGSPRAVGQALRNNPLAPVVPCHRVVATDGLPGGFMGATTGAKIEQKLQLLRDEGVTFVNHHDGVDDDSGGSSVDNEKSGNAKPPPRVDPSCIFDFSSSSLSSIKN